MDREFKGVWIPKEIWLDGRLSMLEKGLLAEIDSLSATEIGCVAGNEYFAEFCHCSKRSITDALSTLQKLGLIETVSFDGRSRRIRSCLQVVARQSSKICYADSQNLRGSVAESAMQSSEICAHINTSIRTPTNTPINRDMAHTRKFRAPDVQEVAAYAREMGWTADDFSPDAFVNFYESKGWRVGKNPMKDWKAAARGWASRNRSKRKEGTNGYTADPVPLGPGDIVI